MKVLLIRPPADPETIGLQHVMLCEPLELEYAAAALEEHGHAVEIFDMLVDDRPLALISAEFRPDVVGFSGYITHVQIIKGLASLVKSLLPGVITLVGGVHAEVVPEDFFCAELDYIVCANAVISLPALLHKLQSAAGDIPPGIWQGLACAKTKIMPPLPDRTRLARFRARYYYMFHNPCALIKTSFGCPYSCNFCFCREITGGLYWARDVADIVDELAGISEQEIYIVDDNFLVDRERIIAFCSELQRRGINKRFLVYGRADFIAANPEVIKRFAAAGLRAVIVGLESCNERELKDYDKQTSVAVNERAVRVLKENGVECYAALILGMDWDREDFSALYRWLRRLGIRFINLQPFTPLPGTGLFADYQDQLIVSRNDYAKWDLAHLVLQPAKLSVRAYYWEILKLYHKVILHPRNVFTMVRDYGISPSIKLFVGATAVSRQYLRKTLEGR